MCVCVSSYVLFACFYLVDKIHAAKLTPVCMWPKLKSKLLFRAHYPYTCCLIKWEKWFFSNDLYEKTPFQLLSQSTRKTHKQARAAFPSLLSIVHETQRRTNILLKFTLLTILSHIEVVIKVVWFLARQCDTHYIHLTTDCHHLNGAFVVFGKKLGMKWNLINNVWLVIYLAMSIIKKREKKKEIETDPSARM